MAEPRTDRSLLKECWAAFQALASEADALQFMRLRNLEMPPYKSDAGAHLGHLMAKRLGSHLWPHGKNPELR